MVAGGGKRTTAWWGLRYAGEAGKRVPVPLIQAFDSFVIFAILILIEHYVRKRPVGFMLAATAALWGLARFFEENVFLKQNDHNGAPLVQGAGLVLFGVGIIAMAVLWRRRHSRADEEKEPDANDGPASVDPSVTTDTPVEV
jgi:prolipoprotein diacylglyceryltransferase